MNLRKNILNKLFILLALFGVLLSNFVLITAEGETGLIALDSDKITVEAIPNQAFTGKEIIPALVVTDTVNTENVEAEQAVEENEADATEEAVEEAEEAVEEAEHESRENTNQNTDDFRQAAPDNCACCEAAGHCDDGADGKVNAAEDDNHRHAAGKHQVGC